MDATGQNMCEFHPSSLDRNWQIYYAAMNQKDWEDFGGKDKICGRCIAVRGVPGETTSGFHIKTIVVKIVDQCPDWACDEGNVDFSTTALKAVTGYGWDKKKITWEYVDCDFNPNEDSSRGASTSNDTPPTPPTPPKPSAEEKAAAAAAAKAKAFAKVKAQAAKEAQDAAKAIAAEASDDAEAADTKASAQMAAAKRAAEAKDAADAAIAAKNVYAKLAAQKERKYSALKARRTAGAHKSAASSHKSAARGHRRRRRRNQEIVVKSSTRDGSRMAITDAVEVAKPTRDARRRGQEVKPKSTTRDGDRLTTDPVSSPKATRDASRSG